MVVVTIVRLLLTVRVSTAVAFCGGVLASVTLRIKRLMPAAVGVPERAPEGLMTRPTGRPPERIVQAYGAVPNAACRGEGKGALGRAVGRGGLGIERTPPP